MRSIVTVTQAASSYDLITTADLQSELGGITIDTALAQLDVSSASASIARYLRRVIPQETIVETFRAERDATGNLWRASSSNPYGPDALKLTRRPVSLVASIVEDGTTLDLSLYDVDPQFGQIFRLNSDQPAKWRGLKIAVTYTAGYVMPPTTGANLPADIIVAARRLASMFYLNRQREPGLKTITIPGVIEKQYWDNTKVGGSDGDLPPDIRTLLDPYREILA